MLAARGQRSLAWMVSRSCRYASELSGSVSCGSLPPGTGRTMTRSPLSTTSTRVVFQRRRTRAGIVTCPSDEIRKTSDAMVGPYGARRRRPGSLGD